MTGLSPQSIRTSIRKLEKAQEITVKATNEYTYICVLKLSDYVVKINKQKPEVIKTPNPIKKIYKYDYGFNGMVCQECLDNRELKHKKSREANG